MENLKFKVPLLLSLFLCMSIFQSCENDRVDLAENPEQREEVYQQILSDEKLFNEFMDEMRESDMSMEWMAKHRPMMRNMYGRNQMRRMMRNNPKVMDSMMQGMMMMYENDTTLFQRNPAMHERLMQHMIIMMDRDTAMYKMMQDRMQQKNMNRTR